MTNPTTAPRCVLCGRHEDEAPPSFSWYLSSVGDSRCPECGKADLRAENERLLKEVATAWFERDEARYGLLEMHRERNEARDDNDRLREVLQSLIEQKKIVNVREADGTYIDVTAWCKAALEQE
jgi:DNA repair exonuclease SbcCD ATPase subunit